jgi:hypothetical protein
MPNSRLDYIQRIYKLEDGNVLERGQSLLSPAVKVEYNGQDNLNVGFAYLYYKLDKHSFPRMLDMN